MIKNIYKASLDKSGPQTPHQPLTEHKGKIESCRDEMRIARVFGI